MDTGKHCELRLEGSDDLASNCLLQRVSSAIDRISLRYSYLPL
jgi:hypothetical protein